MKNWTDKLTTGAQTNGEPFTFEKLSEIFDELPNEPNPLKTILVPSSLYTKPGFKKLAREMGYEVADE